MNTNTTNEQNVPNIFELKIADYERVGDDHGGWRDGTTPLSAHNLNKSDEALYNLLAEDIGYVYIIVNNIKTLINTVNTLTQDLTTEIIRLEKADTALDKDIERLHEIVTTALSSLRADVGYLESTLDNLPEYIENNLAELQEDIKGDLANLQTAIKSGDDTLSDSIRDIQAQINVEIETRKNEDKSLKEADEALLQALPKKVSELENDKGFLTEHQDLSDYVTRNDLSSNYIDKQTFEEDAITSGESVRLNCGTASTIID